MDFLGIVLVATSLKMMSSGDDCVWLAKLVYKESKLHRLSIELTYLFTLVVITFIAFFANILGVLTVSVVWGDKAYFSLVSSIMLIFFSFFILRKPVEGQSLSQKSSFSLWAKISTTFAISFLGSIDELLTYIVVLSTDRISIIPLVMGTIIAGLFVILIINGITRIYLLVNVLSKAKTWIVIFLLGILGLILSIYELYQP